MNPNYVFEISDKSGKFGKMESKKINGNMKIYYDTESDYLEILFGEPPKESYYEKIAPDTYVRIDEETGEIKGYAIYNVKKSDSPLKSVNVEIPKSLFS